MYRKSAHSGSLRRKGYLLACVIAAVAVGLATAGPGAAGGTSFAQYRQHVNRICRSYTPRLKRLDAEVARAVRAGNANRAAADFRRLLQLTLAETVDIQKVSVPADGRARMRRSLRLLHGFQVQLRRVIAASRTSAPALQLELEKLATMTPPLNEPSTRSGFRTADRGSNSRGTSDGHGVSDQLHEVGRCIERSCVAGSSIRCRVALGMASASSRPSSASSTSGCTFASTQKLSRTFSPMQQTLGIGEVLPVFGRLA